MKLFFITLFLFSLTYSDRLDEILYKEWFEDVKFSEIDFLLQQEKWDVLDRIRMGHGAKEPVSQYSVAYLGMFGNIKDTSIVKDLDSIAESQATELPPCEYYCAYSFALKMLMLRHVNKDTVSFDKDDFAYYRGNVQALELLPFIEKYETVDLLTYFKEPSSVDLPAKAMEIIGDNSKGRIIWEAIIYTLASKGTDLNIANLLFSDLLKGYFHDASGDGTVNILTKALFVFISKNREAYNKSM